VTSSTVHAVSIDASVIVRINAEIIPNILAADVRACPIIPAIVTNIDHCAMPFMAN